MKEKQEVPFYYLSARAYAKQTGIGEAEVKKQLKKKELEGLITDNQYKVKVYKDGGISYAQYEAMMKRAIEAETKLEKAKSILV